MTIVAQTYRRCGVHITVHVARMDPTSAVKLLAGDGVMFDETITLGPRGENPFQDLSLSDMAEIAQKFRDLLESYEKGA